jgi:hypothetical protein
VYQIRGRLYLFERTQPCHSRFGLAEERTAGGALFPVSIEAPLGCRTEKTFQGVGQQGIELGARKPRSPFFPVELAMVFHVKPPVY